MNIDGAKKCNGAEVGIVLDNSNQVVLEDSLRLSFEATNNMVKYPVDGAKAS